MFILLQVVLVQVVFGQVLHLQKVVPPQKVHLRGNGGHLNQLLHLKERIENLKLACYINPSSSTASSSYAVKVNAALPIIYPTNYGADPTGKTDSTSAFLQAVKVLLSMGSGHKLANDINDLGGAALDLGGGEYIISSPIVIPANYGNFAIRSGTIRASASFPSKRFLIEVGDDACSNSQGSCNQDIGFEDLLLDSQHVNAGGLVIVKTMGANVGPHMFFLGFNEVGIRVSAGHETMIHETWLGQYLYSDPRAGSPTATGIELLGNDHYITNTIVFNGRIGVTIAGAANLLTGVHTWNLASESGGIGIYVDAPGYTQNRLEACYLDFNSVVAVSPEHLSIEEAFFLCGGNIVLVAVPGATTIKGLNVIGNQWDLCTNDTIVLDQTRANFTSVIDTVVDNNMIDPPTSIKLKSTRAHAQLTLKNTKQWTFDFTNRLLFSEIKSFQYSIALDAGQFARHTGRIIGGNSITIETDNVVSGTVYVQVEQSTDSEPCAATC